MIANRRFLALACLVATAILAACGGGGGGSSSVAPSIGGGIGTTVTSTPTPGPAATATSVPLQSLSMTVTIPKSTSATASTNKRSAQYIAANTASMTLTLLSTNGTAVTGATPQGPFNLTTASNPNCVAGANGTTCTFSFGAPVGSDIFVANTYSGANATGSPLGSGAVLFTVRQNATNAANLALTGPVASVQLLSGTTYLSNGNPQQYEGDSVARTSGPMTMAAVRALAAAHIAKRTTASVSSSRRSPKVSSSAPPPAVLSSRIFVIALDAAGNQIINPTTLDVPITLTLNYNGSPAGSLSLGVTYAGLTSSDSGTASTTADGGTLTIYAPTDIVTLAISQSITGDAYNAYSPSVSATFTPNGGTLTNVTPLTYTVSLPPPGPYLVVTASHIDPWTTNTTETETMSVVNSGTAALTGGVEAYTDTGYNWSYIDNVGSDPSWSCTNNGYYVACYSSATIPAGGSLPLVFHVNPSSAGDIELNAYSYGQYITSADVDDPYTTVPGPSPSPSVGPSSGPYLTTNITAPSTVYATVPGTFTINNVNYGGTATSGTSTLTITVPSDYTLNTVVGSTWTCTGAPPTITCTSATTVAGSGGAYPAIQLTVTAPVGETNNSDQISTSLSVTNGSNTPVNQYVSYNVNSPLSFSNTTYPIGIQYGNSFVSGSNAVLSLGAPPQPAPTGLMVDISTQASGSSSYTLSSDNCTGNVIDYEFSAAFPVTAGTVGSDVAVPLDFLSTSSAQSCMLTIQDVLGNAATLSLGVNHATITVQSTHRSTGVHR